MSRVPYLAHLANHSRSSLYSKNISMICRYFDNSWRLPQDQQPARQHTTVLRAITVSTLLV